MTAMVKELDDEAIINRILQGEREMFRLLIQRYERFCCAVVAKHVPASSVEDVAQEAFISAYQSLRSYSPDHPFTKWFGTITVRRCYDYWRKAGRQKESSLEDFAQTEGEALDFIMRGQALADFNEAQRQASSRELLQAALSRLGAEDRMVLSLVYFEEQSVRETAEILGWTVANVKVRSLRARRKLKQWIEELLETADEYGKHEANN